MTDKKKAGLPKGVLIRYQLLPGDIGYLIWLHGMVYSREYGWDHTFELYVSAPLTEFAKNITDRERIWIVDREGTVGGSIAIVKGPGDSAQLRWFLLHPDLRGQGLGKILMEEALGFCREKGYRSVFLWTEARLLAAAALYRRSGFRLSEERAGRLWGTIATEQRFDLDL